MITAEPVSSYPHLLSPLTIAGMTLPNRMVMGAMHTRIETLDRPHERLAAFYARRAQGEIGLMLTGGYAPSPEGVLDESGLYLDSEAQLPAHLPITSAVNDAGARVVLQILHAGRYARVADCVAPSAVRARINPYVPRALETEEVWALIARYVRTAELAQMAGYAGVEIMGSEGYLINEFTSEITNRRDDIFGGDFEGRIRLPVEILRHIRQRLGPDFMLVYRISAIDLMEGGMTGAQVATLAQRVAAAGADLINTGIGWHESRVPTIAASVPRAAWVAAIRNVKQAVSVPVMASNRINRPAVAEALLANGAADLVSMARPLLADPDFAKKVRLGRVQEIAPCIACNQACLDPIFTGGTASCLVNPRAGHEIEFASGRAAVAKRLAVVGAGPAGMAFAIGAAERGHRVTLYEATSQLGGQLNLARQVPGKGEFNGLLRYFAVMLEKRGVTVHLDTAPGAVALKAQGYDAIIVATGIVPRTPDIPGVDHARVVSYVDVLSGRSVPGNTVAILGAGGIGFDVAEFLLGDPAESRDIAAFQAAWGIAAHRDAPGGLVAPRDGAAPARAVTLFQRKDAALGRSLGKTTGWILTSRLKARGLAMVSGAHYERIDDQGLHYRVAGQSHVLDADDIVLCTGQLAARSLADALRDTGLPCHVIGGADRAEQLDAVRAIDQGMRLAMTL